MEWECERYPCRLLVVWQKALNRNECRVGTTPSRSSQPKEGLGGRRSGRRRDNRKFMQPDAFYTVCSIVTPYRAV